MVFSANAAFAATAIGSAAGNFDCSPGFDLVQLSWSSGTYAVPIGGGSISTWSTQAGPTAGQIGLQVWRPANPATSPQTYQLVGTSQLVTPVASTLNTFTVAPSITVQAGDLLGLRIEGPAKAYCQQPTSNSMDVYGSKLGPNPAVGAIDTFANNPTFQLDVAASVDATITPPPPPPPPPGCDSTDNSATGPTDTAAVVPTDTSTAAPADTSAVVPTDTSVADSTDKAAAGQTDESAGDNTDKTDKSDKSTGGDNCHQ